jgi:hypothetical protein
MTKTKLNKIVSMKRYILQEDAFEAQEFLKHHHVLETQAGRANGLTKSTKQPDG